jgi:hypothetical protein
LFDDNIFDEHTDLNDQDHQVKEQGSWLDDDDVEETVEKK